MTDVQSVSGIDRRTVVRAGVATAWSVPLVQAVAASPAFAVSGPANLSTTSGTIDRASGTYTISITVRNTGGTATQALTATLSSSSAPIQSPTTPAGWSGGPSTYTANAQVSGGGTTTFNMTFTVPQGHIGKSNTVTVTFTTGGTNAVSGSVSRTF
jgi:hypothetical protein